MTGPEHYREAEQAVEASTWQRQQWGERLEGADLQAAQWEMARAQVHATLAAAAATAALIDTAAGDAWDEVTR